MIDAVTFEKELEYLDKFEFRESFVLTYQPPPVTITLEPGKSFEDISEEFKQKMFEASREGLSSMMRQCDEGVREQRKRGMFHNQNFEAKTLATWCGEVFYRRVAYVDREGNNRYLCDEVLGLDKGQRISLYILLRALVGAGEMSYARIARQIEEWTGLRRSPETCRRWVLRVGDCIQSWRRKKCATIFDTPVANSDDFLKDPELLFLEADGCYIYMRMPPELDLMSPTPGTPEKMRKKQKGSAKKEIYLGLYYEGKRPRRGTVGNGNFEVTGKTYFGGKTSVDEFWETAAMMGYERYGLGPLTRLIGGGDGARWLGPHFEEFMNSLFILCRYHWKRDIFLLFREDEARVLIGYLESNKQEETIVFFDTRLNECSHDRSKTKELKDLKNYLLNQWNHIQNYTELKALLSGKDPALSRVGVIEGHIYQVLYLRFESRGGYWSEDGLNALLHVVMAELNGNLEQFARAAGRKARRKISARSDTQEVEPRKRTSAPPCVHGEFPALKRPKCQFSDTLIHIAHPERKKAA
jgi:hypothetical protein